MLKLSISQIQTPFSKTASDISTSVEASVKSTVLKEQTDPSLAVSTWCSFQITYKVRCTHEKRKLT